MYIYIYFQYTMKLKEKIQTLLPVDLIFNISDEHYLLSGK